MTAKNYALMSDKQLRAELIFQLIDYFPGMEVDNRIRMAEQMFAYIRGDATESTPEEIEEEAKENEHVILVAFQVVGDTFETAQVSLMEFLPKPDRNFNNIECWWIAENERYDGSDCDSAMFIPGSGARAWARMHGQDDPVDDAPTQFRLYIDGDGSRKYQFAKEAIADLDRIARASDFGSATLIYIGDE